MSDERAEVVALLCGRTGPYIVSGRVRCTKRVGHDGKCDGHTANGKGHAEWLPAKPRPILERIDAALAEHGGTMMYHELMRAVFPPQDFPKAYRMSSNGGPPGCAWTFGAALRRGDYPFTHEGDEASRGFNACKRIYSRKKARR